MPPKPPKRNTPLGMPAHTPGPTRRYKRYKTAHGDYFGLAVRNLLMARRLKKEFDDYARQTESVEGTDDVWDHFLFLAKSMSDHCLVVVVFCALALEAFVNHYAISRISGSYFGRYLERLSIQAKWVVIPGIVLGAGLKPGSRPLQELDWLVRLRNRLVHYKSHEVHPDRDTTSGWVRRSDAERAVKVVRGLVTALHRLDRDLETWWVSDAATK